MALAQQLCGVVRRRSCRYTCKRNRDESRVGRDRPRRADRGRGCRAADEKRAGLPGANQAHCSRQPRACHRVPLRGGLGARFEKERLQGLHTFKLQRIRL